MGVMDRSVRAAAGLRLLTSCKRRALRIGARSSGVWSSVLEPGYGMFIRCFTKLRRVAITFGIGLTLNNRNPYAEVRFRCKRQERRSLPEKLTVLVMICQRLMSKGSLHFKFLIYYKTFVRIRSRS